MKRPRETIDQTVFTLTIDHLVARGRSYTSTARPALWVTFERALRVFTPVAREIWVGGSFVSSKLEPEDIDIMAVLRPDRLPPPRDQRLEEFLTNTAYALGEPLGVDLKLVYEGDSLRASRWHRWIEWGKPYLRTDATPNRALPC